MKGFSRITMGVVTDSTFWFCVAVLSGWLFFEGYTHHAKETARCEERGKLLSDVPWKYDGNSCVMTTPIKRDIPIGRMVRGAE